VALPKQPPEIVGFFVGANVGLDQVGYMLKEMYARGNGGFQLQPVIEDPSERRARLAQERQEKQEALPPPNGQLKTNGALAPTHARKPGVTVKQWAYELIAARGPIDRAAISQHAKLADISTGPLSTVLVMLAEKNYITRKGAMFTKGPIDPSYFRSAPGHHRARDTSHRAKPNGAMPPPSPAKSRRGPEPSTGSQPGLLLDYLRKHGEAATTRQIKEHITRKKLYVPQIGVVLADLVERGFAERVGFATYKSIA